jgi:zinc protease
MKRRSLAAALLALTGLALAPRALAQPVPRPDRVRSYGGVTEYALSNGLRILLVPDGTRPTVTISIHYAVGSRYEGYGEAGMAHLFEHMLFKGTTTRDNLWARLQERGAVMNGYTWVDDTQFFETLPASDDNLAFAIDLEADRMVHSRLAKADLDKEFAVVRNEFEQALSNPLRVLREHMLSTAYRWHGYGKPTLGSKSDIERVPIDRLRDFYKRYYRPDNATLVIAGRFDQDLALERVRQSFGAIARPPQPLAPTWTTEPPQAGERQVVVRQLGDQSIVGLLYHGAASSHPDFVAEEALVDLLTREPTGRLQRALVDAGLAARVEGTIWPWAEPGVLQCFARLTAGQSADAVRARMIDVVEHAAPIELQEVERWRRSALKDIQFDQLDGGRFASKLGDWAVRGDWRLYFLRRDRIAQLSVHDVERAARRYLTAQNRTVGLLLPEAKFGRQNPSDAAAGLDTALKPYSGALADPADEAFDVSIANIEKHTLRQTLPGGMQLALLPKPARAGAVRLALTLRFGNARTLAGQTGALELLPAMLLRGTTRHTHQELEDEWDRLAAEISIQSGRPGELRVTATTTREHLTGVLGLLAEVLRSSVFPPGELEIVRRQELADLNDQLRQPRARATTTLDARLAAWPTGDARHRPTLDELIGEVSKVRARDLADLTKRMLGAQAASLAIVGSFDADAARAQVARKFDDWRAKSATARLAEPYQETEASEEIVRLTDRPMAFLAVGQQLELRDDDDDYPAVAFAAYVLGGSMNSRLIRRLREREGMSYGTWADFAADPHDRRAQLMLQAMCAPAVADKAMRALVEELETLLAHPIPADELDTMKRSYDQRFQTALAQDAYVADLLVRGLENGRTLAFLAHRNQAIAALPAEAIAAALRKHIHIDKLARITAGDLPGQRSGRKGGRTKRPTNPRVRRGRPWG